MLHLVALLTGAIRPAKSYHFTATTVLLARGDTSWCLRSTSESSGALEHSLSLSSWLLYPTRTHS